MIRQLSPGAIGIDVSIALFAIAVRLVIGLDMASMWAVVIIFGVALALRRLSPALALAAAWAGALIQLAKLLPADPYNFAIVAVLFAAARYGSSLVRLAGLLSVFVGSAIGAVYLAGTKWSASGTFNAEPFVRQVSVSLLLDLLGFLIVMLALLGLGWTGGLLARTQAIARESKQAHLVAKQVAVVELERNQIARDMHDVVAHSLAVVIAQADGARYASVANPGSVDAALTTISSTAREALTDVRLLLGQLRHSQSTGPQPGVADIPILVELMRSAGLGIETIESGASIVIPSGQQVALYRIAQEALTNALKHGDHATPTQLSIEWTQSALTLSVRNSIIGGDVSAEPNIGHGLVGMRERAHLAGAELHVGREGDLFDVTVTMPVTR